MTTKRTDPVSNHTPTPFRLRTRNGRDDCMIVNTLGGRVAYAYTVRSGQFIVTACNAHDELVAALTSIVAATNYGRDAASMGEARAHELARAALAKVTL